jgi:hypothetical protein
MPALNQFKIMRPSMPRSNPNNKRQKSRALGRQFRRTRFHKVGQELIETFDVFMSPMIGQNPPQRKVLTWQVRSPRIDCPHHAPFSSRDETARRRTASLSKGNALVKRRRLHGVNIPSLATGNISNCCRYGNKLL